jgi:hypothetical protein
MFSFKLIGCVPRTLVDKTFEVFETSKALASLAPLAPLAFFIFIAYLRQLIPTLRHRTITCDHRIKANPFAPQQFNHFLNIGIVIR